MLAALTSRPLRHPLFARNVLANTAKKVPTFPKPIQHQICMAHVNKATQQSNGRGPIVKLLVFSLKAMAVSVTITVAAATYQGYRLYTTVTDTLPNMVTYPNPEENNITKQQMLQHLEAMKSDPTVSLGSTRKDKINKINEDIEFGTKYSGLLTAVNSFCWLSFVALGTDFNNEKEMANIFTLNKQKVQEIVDSNALSKLWFYLRFDIKDFVVLPPTIDLNVVQQNSKSNIQNLFKFLKEMKNKDETQCETNGLTSTFMDPAEINAFIDVLADVLYMYSTSRQHNRANNGSRNFSASDLFRAWIIGSNLKDMATTEINSLDTRVDLVYSSLDPFNTGHVEKQDLINVHQLSIKLNNLKVRFFENDGQEDTASSDLQMIEEEPAMKQLMLLLEDVVQDATVLFKSDFYREMNNVAFVDRVISGDFGSN
jgi:hypothetical protein